MAAEWPADVADTLADRVAQVVGEGRTGPDGVGRIGEFACSHKVIEPCLRGFGKGELGAGSDGIGRIGRIRRMAPDEWPIANSRWEVGESRTPSPRP